MKDLTIYKVKDSGSKYYTKKGGRLPDLPIRCLAIGRSQSSGKSTLGINLFTRKAYYGDDFDGDNIYIFSNSLKTDDKIRRFIRFKQIPEENCFSSYDPDILEELYNNIHQDYQDAIRNKEKPVNTLIYLDDIAFSGAFKNKYTIMDRIFSNGRHTLCSIFCSLQSYVSCSTTLRENSNAVFLFGMSNRQLEIVADDHALMPTKDFKKMFRDATKKKHSFLLINYSNPSESRYLNDKFEVINFDET